MFVDVSWFHFEFVLHLFEKENAKARILEDQLEKRPNPRERLRKKANSKSKKESHTRPQVGRRKGRPTLRKIGAHQITASDLNTFTITFPVNTRMKFVMSGDELISMKETFGLCEGRAEQHCYIPVRAT